MRQKTWSHVDDPKAAGRRLREARERAGLSQRQLAFPGCTAAYISRLESGDRTPSLQLLREIGKRLGVSADWLATGADPEAASELLLQADLALRLGDIDEAERLFERARDGEDPSARALAVAGLGRAALLRGNTEDGVRQLEEAQAALGDRVAAAPDVLEALARSHVAREKPDAAVDVLEQGLRVAGSDSIAAARLALQLASTLLERGEAERAAGAAEGAAAALDGIGDASAAAQLYRSLSRDHAARGNRATAARYAARALAALELADGARDAARAHHVLALAELARGNPQRALESCESALPAGDRASEILIHVDRARALAGLGRTDEAREAAVAVAGDVGDLEPEDAVPASTALAEVFVAAGDSERALELYTRTADKLPEQTAPAARTLYARWAELLEAAGRPADALRVLKQAMGAPPRPGNEPAG